LWTVASDSLNTLLATDAVEAGVRSQRSEDAVAAEGDGYHEVRARAVDRRLPYTIVCICSTGVELTAVAISMLMRVGLTSLSFSAEILKRSTVGE
jgi:hypothetical protein